MANKPIKAEVGGGDFELAPEGVFLARCYKMVDLGTQEKTSKFGTKQQRQVMIYWELLQDDEGEAVFMEDGKSIFSISNTYTLSMNSRANLRKHLDSWRGKAFTDEEADGFDITNLLDKFCKIQTVHNKSGDKTYVNIDSIMTTKKTAKGVNDAVSFSVEDPDMEVFEAFPDWLKEKIQQAPEFSGEVSESASEEEDEDDDKIDVKDVPF